MINADLFSIGAAFWAGLANHLWQSTLFAGAAWLLTLFLKKNRARIRHWIWFSVSIKFLIPFSLIVSLGSLIASGWVKAPVEISQQWNMIHTINQPFNPPDLRESSPALNILDASHQSNKIPVTIISIWLCGSFALFLSWRKRGMQVSRMLSKAASIDNHSIEAFHRMKQKHRVSDIVQLVSTRDLMEPGVYGILRPVLLLPTGIMEHINDSELEAIFLHEFEHIRCRDNLIAFIHMIVQALFWFHPVVWWTGSRLYFERELACDEAVLQAARNPRAYAEGILKVCEYCLRSPIACVSGVIGSSLKKRMEGIMKNQIGNKLSFMKILLLSFAGLLVLGIPVALGIMNAPTSQARSFDNGKPDILKTYSKAERSEDPSGTASEEQDQSSLPVNANTMIQTAVNHEKKAVSFKAVPKTASKDNESSIVLAKMETPVKVASSDSGRNDIERNTEGANKYISRGISSLKKDQLEDAVSEFSSAINLDSKKALPYVARGSAYFRLDQFDKALSDYNRAIEIDPDLAAAYQNRGSIYYRQGQLDNAISDYNRAIKINPDFAVAYVDRGNIYQSQGRFDDAISDFSKVLKLYPKNALIHYSMGYAYLMKKQFDNAISDFSIAINTNPKFAVAYRDRGSAYSIKGDYDKAISDYDKAIELNPKNALTYASRGNVYFILNQFDNAISDYNKAIALDPEIGKINGAKKIECRQITQTGSVLKKKVCLTKSQWLMKEKVLSRPNHKVSTYEDFLRSIWLYENSMW